MRTDTGTSARSSTPSVCLPREIRKERRAPGDDREHDVVDGAPEGVLDDLEVLQPVGDADEAPVRADVHVQRRLRGRVQAGPDDLADALRRLARPGERVVGLGERVDRALGKRDAHAQRSAHSRGDQLDGARARGAAARGARSA